MDWKDVQVKTWITLVIHPFPIQVSSMTCSFNVHALMFLNATQSMITRIWRIVRWWWWGGPKRYGGQDLHCIWLWGDFFHFPNLIFQIALCSDRREWMWNFILYLIAFLVHSRLTEQVRAMWSAVKRKSKQTRRRKTLSDTPQVSIITSSKVHSLGWNLRSESKCMMLMKHVTH